jgi:hypothetical protein
VGQVLVPRPRISWGPIIVRAAEIVRSYSTPVTLRQLHYRLVSEPALGYRNDDYCYKRLSDRTAEGRRDGNFPRLIDLTRSILVPLADDGPAAALEAAAEAYRRDRLEGQPVVPILLVEKATLVTLLFEWFGRELEIPIMALRGFQSVSHEREILGWLEQHGRDSYRALYVGDLDPSGWDIERNVRRYLGDRFASWERVAVTAEQIDRYGLVVNPGKGSDSRAERFVGQFRGLFQVEVEALDPDDLRALLRAAIEENWDKSEFDAVRRREDSERRQLRELADEWGNR